MGHMKLYEATEALTILDDLIEEHAAEIEAHGGDIEAIPAIAELLAFAEEDFNSAVERWGLKIRELLAEAEAAKIEAVRLDIMRRAKENAATRLKDYLKRQMEGRGIPKVKSPLVTVRIQANSRPTVQAINESIVEELYAIGSPFIKRKESYSLDTQAVLDAAEAGEAIPDGITVVTGNHLRVA